MRVELWGWDSVTSAWVKCLVNAAGKLIIDPSEIFEDPPTDGETAKAADSNWSYDHNANPDAHLERPRWTLAQTLSPSGVNTIDSAVFAAHDLWMLIYDLTASEAASTQLFLRLNGDSGANYNIRYINNTTIGQSPGSSAFVLGNLAKNNGGAGIVYVTGKRKGTNNSIVCWGGCGFGYSDILGLDGNYTAAADVTKFTICNPTITGKIKIYYMDY